jgi:hypothetical protein
VATLYQIGRSALGPAFRLHTRVVVERARAHGLDALFFLAREGHLLKACFERLRPEGLPVRCVYLPVSRVSTALASVRRLGLRELQVGTRSGPQPGLAGVARSFALDPELVARFARPLGLDLDAPLDLWDGRLAALLADERLQGEVRARGDAARALLRRYLEQHGFFASARAALVDIGWSGTIQDNLTLAFANDAAWPALRGLYFAFLDRRRLDPHAGVAASIEGTVSDWRRERTLAGRAVFFFLELFEQASRAAHGTIIGYVDQGGEVVALLKEAGADHAAERDTDAAVAEIQRGILDAIGEPRPALSIEEDRADAHRRLERLIFAPEPDEIEAIARLVHTDDWGQHSFSSLRPRRVAPWRLDAWRAELARARWKPGFVRVTAGPWVARLYRAYRGLRARRIDDLP